MMELTGEILGLLQRGSPVTRADGVAGVVSLVYASGAVDVATADQTVETESPGIYALYLGSRTGRFHAREWLAERGHDVGNEDRAEVLAWSVLSVWRGGKPLRVAEQWEYWPGGGRARQYRPMRTNAAEAKAARPYPVAIGWQAGVEMGGETGPLGEAAADVSLLRQGWAVVNADGTLTLPPLPGGAQ